jgi:hypothetical protein
MSNEETPINICQKSIEKSMELESGAIDNKSRCNPTNAASSIVGTAFKMNVLQFRFWIKDYEVK